MRFFLSFSLFPSRVCGISVTYTVMPHLAPFHVVGFICVFFIRGLVLDALFYKHIPCVR